MFRSEYNKCRLKGKPERICRSVVNDLINAYKIKQQQLKEWRQKRAQKQGRRRGRRPRRRPKRRPRRRPRFLPQWRDCRRSGKSKKECGKLINKLRREYKQKQMENKNQG